MTDQQYSKVAAVLVTDLMDFSEIMYFQNEHSTSHTALVCAATVLRQLINRRLKTRERAIQAQNDLLASLRVELKTIVDMNSATQVRDAAVEKLVLDTLTFNSRH